ncbi:hypothetical protein MRX96_015141 [Rhipicephalus microplus]
MARVCVYPEETRTRGIVWLSLKARRGTLGEYFGFVEPCPPQHLSAAKQKNASSGVEAPWRTMRAPGAGPMACINNAPRAATDPPRKTRHDSSRHAAPPTRHARNARNKNRLATLFPELGSA